MNTNTEKIVADYGLWQSLKGYFENPNNISKDLQDLITTTEKICSMEF